MTRQERAAAFGPSTLITGLPLVLVFTAPILIAGHYMPDTFIGISGLEQVKRFCIAELITASVSIALIFLLMALRRHLANKALDKEVITKPQTVITAVIFTVIYLLFPYSYSGLRVQTDDAGCKGVMPLRYAQLLYLTDRDIRERQTEVSFEGSTVFRTTVLSKEISKYEYSFATEDGRDIGQLSPHEYRRFNNGLFNKATHEFTVYKNSHVIAAIDGVSETDEVSLNVIEFSYDPETKMLTRELICKNEDELPIIYLVYSENGRDIQEGPINGMTEMYFNLPYRKVYGFRAVMHDSWKDREIPVSESFTVDKTG